MKKPDAEKLYKWPRNPTEAMPLFVFLFIYMNPFVERKKQRKTCSKST